MYKRQSEGNIFNIATVSKEIEAIEHFCKGIPGVSNKNKNGACQQGGSLYNKYQQYIKFLGKAAPVGPRAQKFAPADLFSKNLPLRKIKSELAKGPLSTSLSMFDKDGRLRAPFIDKAMEVLGQPASKKSLGIIELMKAEAERASLASNWFETKFEDVQKNSILASGAEQRAVHGLSEDQMLIAKAQEAAMKLSESKSPESVQKLHEILEAIRELTANSTTLSTEQTKLLAALVTAIQSQDPELAASLGYGITDED